MHEHRPHPARHRALAASFETMKSGIVQARHTDALSDIGSPPPADDPKCGAPMPEQPPQHAPGSAFQPHVFRPRLERHERAIEVQEQRHVLRLS